jgi:hypothetical protein
MSPNRASELLIVLASFERGDGLKGRRAPRPPSEALERQSLDP